MTPIAIPKNAAALSGNSDSVAGANVFVMNEIKRPKTSPTTNPKLIPKNVPVHMLMKFLFIMLNKEQKKLL